MSRTVACIVSYGLGSLTVLAITSGRYTPMEWSEWGACFIVFTIGVAWAEYSPRKGGGEC